jgi:hypothetical protein
VAKANVTTLVDDLAVSVEDNDATSDYYDDIVEELGFHQMPLMGADYVAGVAGQLAYTLPTAAVRGVAFIYDDTQLYKSDKRDLEMLDDYWRKRQGHPAVVSFSDTDQRKFDVVPIPEVSGTAFGSDDPFDAFYANNLTVIYSNRATDVHSWEELPVALEILSREFARDSEHKDLRAAKSWKTLADVFAKLVYG